MGLEEYDNNQTPLDEEEREGLLIPTIACREELDEFEQKNIEEAMLWTLGQKLSAEKILSEKFVKSLHRKMFGQVWSWAGKFRTTDKNLGIDKWQIPIELKKLCDDASYWISGKVFTPDEIALRFKHRIVCIHCFSNGNGRHSRLMADIIITKVYQKPLFSWGAQNLKQDEARSGYLRALKSADRGEFEQLLKFSRL